MSGLLLDLVSRFGVFAVFAGCVVEGETAAILAGFLAHQHLLDFAHAVPAAWLGALAGDTAMFLAGRRYANHRFVARLRGKRGFAHAQRLLERHPALFVFFNRFIYGMRTVGAVTAGLSAIPLGRYVAISAVSCLVWAVLFVSVGAVAGLGAEAVVGTTLRTHEKLLAAALVFAATATLAALVARRNRTKTRKTRP